MTRNMTQEDALMMARKLRGLSYSRNKDNMVNFADVVEAVESGVVYSMGLNFNGNRRFDRISKAWRDLATGRGV